MPVHDRLHLVKLFMNNKQLAIIGMAGAPFLCIGTITEILFPSLFNSRFSGAWGLVYISAWMCTLAAIYRMNVFQLYRFPKVLLLVLFGTLSLANLSNIMLVLSGRTTAPAYFFLDLSWPLSNVLMLILGVSIMPKRGIPKTLRRCIFLTGTWLPLSVVPMLFLGRSTPLFLFGAVYSLLNWGLLAYVTFRLARREEEFYTVATPLER